MPVTPLGQKCYHTSRYLNEEQLKHTEIEARQPAIHIANNFVITFTYRKLQRTYQDGPDASNASMHTRPLVVAVITGKAPFGHWALLLPTPSLL